MAVSKEKVATCDPIWSAMRDEAKVLAAQEPALASFVHATILNHDRLEDALSYHLAKKVGGDDVSPMLAREIFVQAITADPEIGVAVRADLAAVYDRDPACGSGASAAKAWRCSSRAASRSSSTSTSIPARAWAAAS
jgi:serine O-acetyltransferase